MIQETFESQKCSNRSYVPTTICNQKSQVDYESECAKINCSFTWNPCVYFLDKNNYKKDIVDEISCQTVVPEIKNDHTMVTKKTEN